MSSDVTIYPRRLGNEELLNWYFIERQRAQTGDYVACTKRDAYHKELLRRMRGRGPLRGSRMSRKDRAHKIEIEMPSMP